MIGRRYRGQDTRGLVLYLAGQGKHQEHHDQRIVACSEGLGFAPGTNERGEFEPVPVGPVEAGGPGAQTTLELAAAMTTTQSMWPESAQIAAGNTWHLVLSAPEGERLSDEQWGEATTHVMERMGFAGGEARATCPWVAIRHGDTNTNGYDHCHVAVSLVAEDGTKADTYKDLVRLREAVNEIEERYGLQLVGRGRERSGPAPDLAPRDWQVTHDQDLDEPKKVTLERQVRGHATAAKDEAEFVRRCRAGGLEMRPRYAQGGTEIVEGYSVRSESLGYASAGGNLAKDLSIKRLRADYGWSRDIAIEETGEVWRTGRPPERLERDGADRESVRLDPDTWRRWADKTRTADWRGVPAAQLAREAAGATSALAQRVETAGDGPLHRLAALYRNSAQQAEPDPYEWRRANLSGVAMVASQAALGARWLGKGRSSEVAGWIMLAAQLVRLADELAKLHQAQNHFARAAELARAKADVIAEYPQLGRIIDRPVPEANAGRWVEAEPAGRASQMTAEQLAERQRQAHQVQQQNEAGHGADR